VELMGGQVWVDSAGSAGSTFSFTVLAGFPGETAQPGAAPPDAFLARGVRTALRVLVVDDDVPSRRLAEVLVRNAGHAVRCAEGGRQGAELARDGAFDVVLMDVQMPDMDGVAATRAIRESENVGGHHTVVIAMTASALPSDGERFLKAGMDGHLVKPILGSALVDVIEKAVKSRTP
jgi:CheY-like chemotaxis protein